MQLINAKTVKGFSVEPTMYIEKKKAPYSIIFPRSTVDRMKLKVGQRIAFFNDGAEWSMFINADMDSFELIAEYRGARHGLQITNGCLARMIQRTTGHRHFKIVETKRQASANTVYNLIPK